MVNIKYDGKESDIEFIGIIRFELDDYRNLKFNESTELTYDLYGSEDDEILSLENYYYYCKKFASAMGFADKSINEWFGDY